MAAFILIIGLQGTGKSTLARQLAEQLKAISISTEAVRHALFEPTRLPGQDQDFTDHEIAVSYRAVNYFVSLISDLPLNVVVDGVFRYEAQRQSLISLAAGRQIVKVHLHCEESVVKQRLLRRQAGETYAPGGINAHQKAKTQFERPTNDYLHFDTTTLRSHHILEALLSKHLLTS